MDSSTFGISITRGLSGVAAAAYQDRRVAEILLAVRRRRVVVAAMVALAICAAGGAVALRSPRYRAEAIVQLQFNERDVGAPRIAEATVAVEASSIVQSEARIIRSQLIARRVIERLGLDRPEPSHGVRALMAGLVERIARPLGAAGSGAAAADGDSARTRRLDAIEKAFLSNLTVETDNRSYLVVIGYASDNPEKSAAVVNAVADEYLSLRAQAVVASMDQVAGRLRTDLDAVTSALREADAAVVQYRMHSGFLEGGAEGESVDQQRLRNLSDQLSNATLARIREEEWLKRTQMLTATDGLPEPDGPQSGAVQQAQLARDAARRELVDLRARLGGHHPLVMAAQARLGEASAALSREIDRAISTEAARVDAARQTEAALRSQVVELQHSIIGTGKAQEVELRDLESKSLVLREQVAALTTSYRQALTIRDLRSVPASVMVPGQPGPAESSHAAIIFVVATLGGLVAGVALATLLESGDHGIRTSDDVPEGVYARCLGMVPELPAVSGKLTARGARKRRLRLATFNEAVRLVGVAAGLFGEGESGECQIVLVTSAMPGEGRSTLCRALARALFLAGQRVMVVDGALRREVSGSDDPTSHVTAGEASVTVNDVRSSDSQTPAVVSKGRYVVVERKASAPDGGADVFGPGRLVRLIAESRRHFDVILLEGPPVMLVGDSLVLARLADRVIHVVRWATTKQRTVRAALQRLRENEIQVSGIAVTRVDLARHANLGFVDQCTFFHSEEAFYAGLYGNSGEAVATPQ